MAIAMHLGAASTKKVVFNEALIKDIVSWAEEMRPSIKYGYLSIEDNYKSLPHHDWKVEKLVEQHEEYARLIEKELQERDEVIAGLQGKKDFEEINPNSLSSFDQELPSFSESEIIEDHEPVNFL